MKHLYFISCALQKDNAQKAHVALFLVNGWRLLLRVVIGLELLLLQQLLRLDAVLLAALFLSLQLALLLLQLLLLHELLAHQLQVTPALLLLQRHLDINALN